MYRAALGKRIVWIIFAERGYGLVNVRDLLQR